MTKTKQAETEFRQDQGNVDWEDSLLKTATWKGLDPLLVDRLELAFVEQVQCIEVLLEPDVLFEKEIGGEHKRGLLSPASGSSFSSFLDSADLVTLFL